MEAVNGILQLAKRMARGFRNFHYFRIAAYLKAGGLQLNVVHARPHSKRRRGNIEHSRRS
ncbi:MAG: transposase [Phycisphaerae bacterium]